MIEQLKDAGVWDGMIALAFYTKFDGLSVVLEVADGVVKSAITRGDKDTGAGQNKTGVFGGINFNDVANANGIRDFGLKCEALVSKSAFNEYNERFGGGRLIDERSAATSILNNDYPSPEQLKYLTLMPLMITINGKDIPLPNPNVRGFEWADKLYAYDVLCINNMGVKEVMKHVKGVIDELSTQICEHSDYPADGIVIRILDAEYVKVLGRNEEECVNNWERAYKFPPETAKTTLLDIEQAIGYLGKVSFIAKVKPVKLKNKTIKSISIGSLDRFKSLDLAIGDEVIVQYDIIPYLTRDNTCKRSNNHPIDAIVNCPSCGEPLEFVPELSCVNPDCPARVVGRIYNYCMKIGIEGIGPETVLRMYHHGGIKNIPDLYKVEIDDLLRMGFGPTESINIVNAIDSIDTVDDYVLLGSLGIPSVSRKIFEKVLDVVKFKDLLALDNDKKSIKILTTVKGIKSKTARKILDGLEAWHDDIMGILKYVKVRSAKKYGMTVCFTKVRDRDFEKYLKEELAIGVTEALTRKTDLLITGTGDSTKVEKAKKWGIPIMTIGEAYDKFMYKGGK